MFYSIDSHRSIVSSQPSDKSLKHILSKVGAFTGRERALRSIALKVSLLNFRFFAIFSHHRYMRTIFSHLINGCCLHLGRLVNNICKSRPTNTLFSSKNDFFQATVECCWYRCRCTSFVWCWNQLLLCRTMDKQFVDNNKTTTITVGFNVSEQTRANIFLLN